MKQHKLICAGDDLPSCGEDDHDYEYDYSDDKDDDSEEPFDSTTEVNNENYKQG